MCQSMFALTMLVLDSKRQSTFVNFHIYIFLKISRSSQKYAYNTIEEFQTTQNNHLSSKKYCMF